MSYVPGYNHDLFISYAHGDDRDWINRFIDRLKPELKRRLGMEPAIWIDDDFLRKSRDFRQEIPASVRSSAVFLLLCSPSYLRSEYCVREECRAFDDTIAIKRARFAGAEFANEQFALRTLLLPVDNNEHWQLFPGLTDISFCDEAGTFLPGSPDFEASFRKITGELMLLLKRMRNRSTPIFVYPSSPSPALKGAHETLSAELSAQSYRLLPDRLVSLTDQVREASISVFLLGDLYDETIDQLTQAANLGGKPWLIWCSPESQDATPEQIGFIRHLERLDSPAKTFLDVTISPSMLKEEVLALLKPSLLASQPQSDKPRVYLIYNSRDRLEKGNVGQIIYHYRNEFQFDLPDDPAQHTARLAYADGVLLVWGHAEEGWCAPEFESMLQVSHRARSKGLCLFDPKDAKTAVMRQLRDTLVDVHVVEQFGQFDPSRLETFFSPIRRRPLPGAP
jgi:hypothetical protein